MKTLALIKRRSDFEREAFREHYERVHAPLAIETLLEGTRRYVRHHLRRELLGSPGFDVVTAFWYPDVATALAVAQRSEAPEGEAIRRDELSFMDKPANTFFAVSEQPLLGSEQREAALQVLALVRRPAGETAAEFAARYEAEELPRLLAATHEPSFGLHHRSLGGGEDGPAYDAVTQLHAGADRGLAEWAEPLVAQGAAVVIVEVETCESALPWLARGA